MAWTSLSVQLLSWESMKEKEKSANDNQFLNVVATHFWQKGWSDFLPGPNLQPALDEHHQVWICFPSVSCFCINHNEERYGFNYLAKQDRPGVCGIASHRLGLDSSFCWDLPSLVKFLSIIVKLWTLSIASFLSSEILDIWNAAMHFISIFAVVARKFCLNFVFIFICLFILFIFYLF